MFLMLLAFIWMPHASLAAETSDLTRVEDFLDSIPRDVLKELNNARTRGKAIEAMPAKLTEKYRDKVVTMSLKLSYIVKYQEHYRIQVLDKDVSAAGSDFSISVSARLAESENEKASFLTEGDRIKVSGRVEFGVFELNSRVRISVILKEAKIN